MKNSDLENKLNSMNQNVPSYKPWNVNTFILGILSFVCTGILGISGWTLKEVVDMGKKQSGIVERVDIYSGRLEKVETKLDNLAMEVARLQTSKTTFK